MKRLAGLLFLGVTAIAMAVPAQVIIIRHAEKPAVGNHLTQRGLERAAALVPYFLYTPDLLKFGRPVAVYAQDVSFENLSTRPIQTCNPTARALGVPVQSRYHHDDYPKMAAKILRDPDYNGKTVLICWEHHVIPKIAQAFGVQQAPGWWPDEVFDRTWVIQFYPDGRVKSFQNLPQRLLFGDSPN